MTFFTQVNRDYIYQLISSYYDNPIMKKIKEMNQMSMYMCKLPCLLNEKRYLVAMTSIYKGQEEPIGNEMRLSDLRWKTFMARVLSDELFEQSAPQHHYEIKRDDMYFIPLQIKSRNMEISVYTASSYPHIIISLLHTQNYIHQYPNEGNLISALETFQTLLSWKDDEE